MAKSIFENLQKLPISDCFDLYIQNENNFNYNFANEEIKTEGFGYYDTIIPQPGDHRFYLELSISKKAKGKTLIAIMMNPSNTFPKQNNKQSTIDDTVKNVVRMAYRLDKYNKVVILNSFALILGTVKTPIKKDSTQAKNIEIIESIIKSNTKADYLLAWGGKALDTAEIQKYLKNVNKENIFVYLLSKKGYPCHPSRVVENRYKYVSKFLNSHNNKSSFELYKLPQ